MTIALIGQKYFPAGIGGVDRHVEEYAIELARAGQSILVYSRYYLFSGVERAHQAEGENMQSRIRTVLVPTIYQKHLATPVSCFFATLHVLFQKVDVIHYHGIGPALFIPLVRIFRPRTRVIFTFHSQDYHHSKWGVVARSIFRMGECIGCTFSNQIIVVSHHLFEYVRKKYRRTPFLIQNAVPFLPKSSLRRLKEFGIQQPGYLLVVSRLVRHKGVHFIIAAYRALGKAGVSVPPLVIVGSSSFTDGYAASLHKLAQHEQAIMFLETSSTELLAELYSNARLFIQASEDEGISIALLEALSYTCPVIVSDIAGNREVITTTENMFDVTDVATLAEKIALFLSNDDLCTHVSRVNSENAFLSFNLSHAFLRYRTLLGIPENASLAKNF